MHTVVVNHISAGKFGMRLFSSSNFNKLFLSGPIPSSTIVSKFDYSDISLILERCIEDVINVINENGGFTIVYWYSRGDICNDSLINSIAREQERADSGKLNYYIVQILPINRDYLKRTSDLRTALGVKKFNVLQLGNDVLDIVS